MRGIAVLLLVALFLISVVMMVVDSKASKQAKAEKQPEPETDIYTDFWLGGPFPEKPEFKPPPPKVERQSQVWEWPGWILVSLASFVGLVFLVVQGRMSDDLTDIIGTAKRKQPPV